MDLEVVLKVVTIVVADEEVYDVAEGLKELKPNLFLFRFRQIPKIYRHY